MQKKIKQIKKLNVDESIDCSVEDFPVFQLEVVSLFFFPFVGVHIAKF